MQLEALSLQSQSVYYLQAREQAIPSSVPHSHTEVIPEKMIHPKVCYNIDNYASEGYSKLSSMNLLLFHFSPIKFSSTAGARYNYASLRLFLESVRIGIGI